MGMFSSVKLNHLKDLLIYELEDLYDAEIRLTNALPKMADAATSTELKSAFTDHLAETQEHVHRLEAIFQALGIDAKRETCDAMKGLISEGEEMIGADGDPMVRDAALIAAAQRVEHYEMAAYGTVRTFANHLGLSQIAATLQATLDEEHNADKLLTEIAESGINAHAHASV